jgi:hypothetical protein
MKRKSGMTTKRGTEGMVRSIVEGELLSREEAHRVDNPDGKRERRELRYSVEVKRKLSGWAVRVKLLSISTASDLPTEFNSVCARV